MKAVALQLGIELVLQRWNEKGERHGAGKKPGIKKHDSRKAQNRGYRRRPAAGPARPTSNKVAPVLGRNGHAPTTAGRSMTSPLAMS